MDDVVGCQRDVNTDRVYGKDCWNPNGNDPNQYDTDQTVRMGSVQKMDFTLHQGCR